MTRRTTVVLIALALSSAACAPAPGNLDFIAQYGRLVEEPGSVNTAFDFDHKVADDLSRAIDSGHGTIRESFDGPDLYDVAVIRLYDEEPDAEAAFKGLRPDAADVVAPPHHLAYDTELCSISGYKYSCVALFGTFIAEGHATADGAIADADAREEVLFHASMLMAGAYKHWIQVRLDLGLPPP